MIQHNPCLLHCLPYTAPFLHSLIKYVPIAWIIPLSFDSLYLQVTFINTPKMSSETPQEYSVDEEILYFFRKTSATKSSCDAYAQELVGGSVVPVTVQGVCSYTVYAGPNHEFVVQFRLQSLGLSTKMTTLACDIYGSLVPSATFHGQIGEEGVDGKEPLSVYVMSRVKGISHLDFILAHNFPEDSLEYCTWRENLVSDIAGYSSRLSSRYLD